MPALRSAAERLRSLLESAWQTGMLAYAVLSCHRYLGAYRILAAMLSTMHFVDSLTESRARSAWRAVVSTRR